MPKTIAKENTKRKQQLKYICDVLNCTESFSAKTKFAAHQKTHGSATTTEYIVVKPDIEGLEGNLDDDENADNAERSAPANTEVTEGLKLTCQLCERDFPSIKSLAAHKSAHVKRLAKATEQKKPKKKGGGKYNCSYGNCRQGFDDKKRFYAHERRHFKQKPHNCDYCLKEFSDMGKLRVHLRTHTGAKPYRCKHCPQKFANEGNMRKHCLRIHGDATPYTCPYCGLKLGNPRHWCFRP